VLTGDETVDAKLRVQHAYGTAPSMHLGKALLDLVAQPKKAGEACLVVCDRLSSGLPDRPSDEKLHTINLIQQLLLYAKLQVRHSLSHFVVCVVCVVCVAQCAESKWSAYSLFDRPMPPVASRSATRSCPTSNCSRYLLLFIILILLIFLFFMYIIFIVYVFIVIIS